MTKYPAAELVCTQDEYEGLHAALDKVRSTSATVTVSKQALFNLLFDHAIILKLAQGGKP